MGLLASCEPKKEEVQVPAGPVYGDTIATKTGKGFTPLAILVGVGAGGGANGGLSDSYGMIDMTSSPDGKTLQMATCATLTTQQDPLNTLEKRFFDLETKSLVKGPAINLGSDDVKTAFNNTQSIFYSRSFGFQRGTSKFFKSNYRVSNFGIVTGTVTGDFSYSRSNTFATQPRVTDLGEVVEDMIVQTTPRLDGNLTNQMFFHYRNSNLMTTSFYNQRIVSPDLVKSSVIVGGQVEASKINDDKVLVFCNSRTRLFAAEAPISSDNTQLIFIDSLPLPSEWQSSSICTRISDDGTGFGVVIGNNEANGSLSLMSAQYNVATKKFTQNITNLSIPGFDKGKINFDIDAQGNMYFDHWANNFQSDSTISIYKASGSAFSVVGQDDIIKSGSVVNVRYLNGKVYAAVSYTYSISNGSSSSKKFRMAIIKQD